MKFSTLDTANLSRLLNALRLRARVRHLLWFYPVELLVCVNVALLGIIAYRAWPLSSSASSIKVVGQVAAVAGIVLAVALVVMGLAWTPREEELAREADQAADTRNRLVSALEFMRQPHPSPLMQAAIADAETVAAGLNARGMLSWRFPVGLRRALVANLGLCLTLMMALSLLSLRVARAGRHEGAAANNILTKAEREKQTSDLQRQLEQLTRDWQEQRIASTPALHELQKLEAQLAQLNQQSEPRPAQVASQKAERAKQQENSGSEQNDNAADNAGEDTQPSNTRPPGSQQLQELAMMAADLRQSIESKQMQQPQFAQAPQQNQNRQNQQQQQQQQAGGSQQQQGQQQQQANQGQQAGQQPQSGNNASQRGSQSQQQGGQQTGGQPQQSGNQQGAQQSGSAPGQQANQQGQQQGNQQGQQQGNQNGEQAGEGRPGQRGEQGKAPGKQAGQQPGKGSPSNQIGLGQSNPEEQEGKGTGAESEQKKPGGGSTNLIYVIPLPSSLRGQMGRGPAHTRTMKTDPSPANAMRPLTGQSPSASSSETDKLTSGRVPEQFKQNVREYFQPRKTDSTPRR